MGQRYVICRLDCGILGVICLERGGRERERRREREKEGEGGMEVEGGREVGW